MLTQEELEASRSLKVCEQSYLMYEDSKKEILEVAAKKVDKNGELVYTEQAIKKNLQLIETAQQDVIDQYIQMGGKLEDLKNLRKSKKKAIDRKHLEEIMKRETAKDEMAKYIAEMRSKDVEYKNNTSNEMHVIEEQSQPNVNEPTSYSKFNVNNGMFENKEKLPVITKEEMELYLKQAKNPINNTINVTEKLNTIMPSVEEFTSSSGKMYDVVKLPSKGQCYRNKKDNVKVSYLTAFDENMILSPNLYKDGKFIDYLLKAKVLDSDINPEDLTKGDRDAIILWLRATGYGNEYPIVVTDDETGMEFETTVDLSTLNYKPFKLIGDENGYFDFTLPGTKDIIKFKFLTVKDIEFLNKLKTDENKKLKVLNIKQLCNDLTDATRDTNIISYNSQQKIKSAVDVAIDEINKNYNEENDLSFSHELTDRLLLQTVSINGIQDRKYIENYIFSMNVRDAAAYRKYILDNEPGVDFNVEVERPESLGGGSIKSFLRLDQFIFINV